MIPASGRGSFPSLEGFKAASSMHDKVCDFPLPWEPQINADHGAFVLTNIRLSFVSTVGD